VIRISLKNLDSEISSFKRKLVREADSSTEEQIVQPMLLAMKSATPVDTGEAQASWSYISTPDSMSVGYLLNDTDYIKYLNQGSSDQAPAYFIETVAAYFGQLVFPVVEDL
jgi:hypothetical protein